MLNKHFPTSTGTYFVVRWICGNIHLWIAEAKVMLALYIFKNTVSLPNVVLAIRVWEQLTLLSTIGWNTVIRGHSVLWVLVSYVLSHHGELSAAASPLLKADTCDVPGTVVGTWTIHRRMR